MWSEMVIYFIRWKVSNKKQVKNGSLVAEMLRAIFCCAARSEFVALGGASLSDEQREEMTNREGVASGGATTIFSYKILYSKK